MSMTLRHNLSAGEAQADNQPPEVETRMRRALGLLPAGAPRVRVRNGDSAVVVEHRGERPGHASVNRVAAAEAALAEERHAREHLARQLRDAEAALREAQTKRGHAELAHNEAMDALAAERSARAAAEEHIRRLQAELAAAHTPAPAGASPQAENIDIIAPKRRGRPLGSKSRPKSPAAPAVTPSEAGDDADGAIAWWVPGWRERI